ncbi:MAG: hypothetical protein BM558_09690 [Roseobacter sp. MedPE-SW]|nr:MAG: hypothetical protein BM558_09690 [Roseobacter sp. MedPE-SW]
MRLKDIGTVEAPQGSIQREGIREINFHLKADAIASFLTSKVRKEHIDCDSFNRLFFIPRIPNLLREEPQIKYKSLCVDVPIDWAAYEQVQDSAQGFGVFICDFYRLGIAYLRPEQGLPQETMLAWVDAFERAGYEHTGLFKKRVFRQVGLTAELHCKADFHAFQLRLIVKKGKETLLDEVILTEDPDPLLYHHKFKEIELRDGQIVVTMRLGQEFLFAKPVLDILPEACAGSV